MASKKSERTGAGPAHQAAVHASMPTQAARSAAPRREGVTPSAEARSLARRVGDRRAQWIMAGADPGGMPPRIGQPELAVNAPGDAYEREADRVADAVMGGAPAGVARRSGGTALRRCACGGTCASCRGEEEPEELRREEAGAAADTPGFAPPIVHDVLASPGRPLEAGTRAHMEERIGAGFGGVRVHADARAADSARAVNAHAYTVGGDVVFAAGRYAPGTREGDRLIAHELAHVVQQGEGAPAALRRNGDAGVPSTGAAMDAGGAPGNSTAATATAPPAAGTVPASTVPAGTVPADILAQITYAGTVLRRVQPLPPQQEARLNDIIGNAPVYALIVQRDEKRAELQTRQQWITYHTRVNADFRAAQPSGGSDAGVDGGTSVVSLPGGTPLPAADLQRLVDEAGVLAAEIERLERVIRTSLSALGIEESQLVHRLADEFPRLWIDRAKTIVNAMLDENRDAVVRERARYSEAVCSQDTAGLLAADEQLGTLLLDIRDLERETQDAQRQAPIAGVPDDPDLASRLARAARLRSEVIPARHQDFQAQRIRLARTYPVLLDPHYTPGIFQGAPPDRLSRLTGEWLDEILEDISTTRENIQTEQIKVWHLNIVPALTYQSMGVEPDSVLGDAVRHFIEGQESDAQALAVASGVLQVGATILATAIAGPLGGALMGGLFTLGQLAVHGQEYAAESAAQHVALDPAVADISQNEPNLLWIVLDVVALGLEAGAVISALRPAARAMMVSGEVAEFAASARRAAPEAADRLITSAERHLATGARATGHTVGSEAEALLAIVESTAHEGPRLIPAARISTVTAGLLGRFPVLGHLTAGGVERIVRAAHAVAEGSGLRRALRWASAARGQLLEEIAAARVRSLLTTPAGRQTLGLGHIADEMVFIEGNRIRDTAGAMLTDGIVAVRRGDRLEIVAVVESKAGGFAAGGLTQSMTGLRSASTSEIIMGLVEASGGRIRGGILARIAEIDPEVHRVIVTTRGANLEAFEQTYRRIREALMNALGRLSDGDLRALRQQIVHSEGQVARDLERLMSGEDRTVGLVIDGGSVTATVPRRPMFLGAAPSNVSLGDISEQLQREGYRFQALDMGTGAITTGELDQLARELVDTLGPDLQRAAAPAATP